MNFNQGALSQNTNPNVAMLQFIPQSPGQVQSTNFYAAPAAGAGQDPTAAQPFQIVAQPVISPQGEALKAGPVATPVPTVPLVGCPAEVQTVVGSSLASEKLPFTPAMPVASVA